MHCIPTCIADEYSGIISTNFPRNFIRSFEILMLVHRYFLAGSSASSSPCLVGGELVDKQFHCLSERVQLVSYACQQQQCVQ
ncbi:hypothetical protein EON65_41170 [archaeon]|nr:MAG: hypothetical protein EON65_41170 [archaeon]